MTQATLFDEQLPDPNEPGGPTDGGEVLTLSTFAERAYLDYAISVVKGRALPDERDGQAAQIGGGGRRRAGQAAPARRPVGLRRAGAHGAGLFAALSADRRPG